MTTRTSAGYSVGVSGGPDSWYTLRIAGVPGSLLEELGGQPS
ncbi:hypothetical protein [Streptomyces sp. NPDC014995]